MTGEPHRGRAGNQPAAVRLEVLALHEREAIVFKPAGLSSERPGSDDTLDSLIARARARFAWPDAQLPHRLDRPTRGIAVISRDRDAAAVHAEEIRSGRWTKWYLARIPSSAQDGARASTLVGPHRAYLKRVGARAEVVRSGGDPSRLTVLAVEAATDARDESHALILLETGRYHQIRAMLGNLGFPLVGDAPYGGRVRGGLTRGIDSASPRIDLEAAALRIARPEGVTVYRLISHPARSGVAATLERALDEAVAGPVSGP